MEEGIRVQQVAVAEVKEDEAAIPPQVLRTLGVSNGDLVAFIEHDDGSISLAKVPSAAPKRPVSEYIGIFAAGRQGSLKEELALLREMRYGEPSVT